MLRKCIALFLALILFMGSASASDYHLDAEVTASGRYDSRSIFFNVLFGEKELLLLSSLFPSFALSVPVGAGMLYTDDLNSLFAPQNAPIYVSLDDAGFFKEYSESIREPEREGFFSGDLFDGAHTVKTAAIGMDELVDYIRAGYGKEDAAVSLIGEILSRHMSGRTEPDLSGTVIQWSVYDQGKYMTLILIKDDMVFATVSLDYSRENRIRAVIGYAENGRNYYWDTEAEQTGENQVEFRVELLSDAMKKGFRTAKNSTPVLKFNFATTALPSIRQVFTTGMFTPSNGMDSILFSSTFSLAEKPTLTADLYFSSSKDNVISVKISADDIPLDTEDRTVLPSYAMSESGQLPTFTAQLAVNFLHFYSAVKEIVPAEYQDILYFLFHSEKE